MDDQPSQDSEADALIQQGMAASRSGQTEVALALFRRAAQQAPGSGIPQFLIGAELMQAGQVHDAENAYANAVLLAPDFDMARYQLGLLQFTSNRAAVALVIWAPLFQRPRSYALQRIVHGFAALAQDDFAEAKSCFEQGISLNRDNEALNDDLRMLLERIAQVQPAAGAAQPEAKGADTPGAIDAESAHVLLANYRQRGPGH